MTNQLSFDKIEFVTYGAYDTFPGKLNPIAAAIRGESEMGGGGGGLKAILGAVVAIAIPFVAPYVATSIFGASVMAGSFGTLAAAATGAVLGAANASLTGGDVGRGAIFGGLGGGLTQGMGGFGSTNNPVFGQATTQNAGFFGPTGSVTGAGQGQTGLFGGSTTNLSPTPVPADAATVATQPQNLQPVASSNAGTTLSSQPAGSYAGINVNPAVTPTPGANSVLNTPPVDYSVASAANLNNGVGLRVPTSMTGDITSVSQIAPKPTTFFGELGSRFTNPARMADMAILATPQIIGQVYAMQAGKEQQKQLEQYQKELKALEGKDQAAYELKLKEAQEYIANAKNINPNYWGQMAANQANTTGARRLAETYRDAPMAGLRDLSGERRRSMIGLSENVGTAYNQGYQSGVGLRDQAMRTGYGMLPNAPRTALEGARGMSDMYANLDRARAGAAQGVAQTASYFTYPYLSNYRV